MGARYRSVVIDTILRELPDLKNTEIAELAYKRLKAMGHSHEASTVSLGTINTRRSRNGLCKNSHVANDIIDEWIVACITTPRHSAFGHGSREWQTSCDSETQALKVAKSLLKKNPGYTFFVAKKTAIVSNAAPPVIVAKIA